MAVSVSSKTLEATTLVIQSDLDVIVKSSRDEVFVFAENMRTGKPWPGARLLISNGRQVFAEETTGADGVLQKSYKELKDAGDVRVFAVAEGNVASNVIDLQGVGVAARARRQGIHLHRSARVSRRPGGSRPRLSAPRGRRRLHDREGQEVHARRDRTTGNRLLSRETVKLGQFGTFPRLLRAADAPAAPGAVPRLGRTTTTGRTTRARSRFTNIASSRSGFRSTRRGASTIAARRSRGSSARRITTGRRWPAAKSATNWPTSASTRPRPTRRARSISSCPPASSARRSCSRFKVALPERNLQTAVNYMLSAQAFSIRVSAVRPVYVAGETFETTVVTKDAEGKPIGQKLTLKVSRADHGQRNAGRAARRGARRSRRPLRTARLARRSRSPRGARTSSASKEPTASRTRSADNAACRFRTTRTTCGCASWPTPTRTRSATRRRSRSIGASGRRSGWSPSRAPACWTTGSSN